MHKFITNLLLDKKLYQYLCVGGSAAIVDLGVFLSLNTLTDQHYLINNSISFVLATFVNYLLCVRYVFDASGAKNALTLTYIVSFVGLMIQNSVVWLGIAHLAAPIALAKIFAMGSSFFWNFLARKYWVFGQNTVSTAANPVVHKT